MLLAIATVLAAGCVCCCRAWGSPNALVYGNGELTIPQTG